MQYRTLLQCWNFWSRRSDQNDRASSMQVGSLHLLSFSSYMQKERCTVEIPMYAGKTLQLVKVQKGAEMIIMSERVE